MMKSKETVTIDSIALQVDAPLIRHLRREIVLLWIAATTSSVVIVLCIFGFLFVIQPHHTAHLSSRNFISNNPLETNGTTADGISKWLQDFSKSTMPIDCHSHNDYLRPYPVFSGLAAGCVSTEADVWLSADGKDLLVGHHRSALSPAKTLQSLYIDPLMSILDAMNAGMMPQNNSTVQLNGVFRTQPDQSLTLLIDVKDDPVRTWPILMKQLEPLRRKLYLSRHNRLNGTTTQQPSKPNFWAGPITVVGTGNIIAQRHINIGSDAESWRQYHDVFIDAPLEWLGEPVPYWADDYTQSPSDIAWQNNEFHTASVNFLTAIGVARAGFAKSQINKIRQQIQAAQDRNLISRYWGTPSWPISHRDYVWGVLWKEEIGLLNADDVQSAAKREWSHAYTRETIWIGIISAYIFCTSIFLTRLTRRAIKKIMR